MPSSDDLEELVQALAQAGAPKEQIERTYETLRRMRADEEYKKMAPIMARRINTGMNINIGMAGGGGGGGVGGLSGMGQAGMGNVAQAGPRQLTERELLQDLLARAVRNAGRQPTTMQHVPLQIGAHKEIVKKILNEFTEAADYIEAQIPMVEAAFKSQPELQIRMVACLHAAYNKLCFETFGDGKPGDI